MSKWKCPPYLFYWGRLCFFLIHFAKKGLSLNKDQEKGWMCKMWLKRVYGDKSLTKYYPFTNKDRFIIKRNKRINNKIRAGYMMARVSGLILYHYHSDMRKGFADSLSILTPAWEVSHICACL